MAKETRSLWEQLDSDVEPWRTGRTFLLSIAAFQFLTQLYSLAITALAGALEATAAVAAGCVIFWFLFYFVWIGFNWIRWLWGAWNLVAGFCLLIWGWRDSNNIQLGAGTITFAIGFILCFSSSIYFFAKRQRESVRWLEAVLMGGLCLFLLGAIAVALVGLVSLREAWRQSATRFAMEANHRIYQDGDYDWVRARVSERSSAWHGAERLQNFFRINRIQLGAVNSFEQPRASIVMRLVWPPDFQASVRVDCVTTAVGGPLETHEIVSGKPEEWQLEHMWWDWVPLPPRK